MGALPNVFIMEFDQLNDLYIFRYGVDLPFDAEQIDEWTEPAETSSDAQYRYFHQRYTQHLRGNSAPDADFEEMLELFGGDFQLLAVCYIQAGAQLLSFFFDTELGQLLGMYPRAGFIATTARHLNGG